MSELISWGAIDIRVLDNLVLGGKSSCSYSIYTQIHKHVWYFQCGIDSLESHCKTITCYAGVNCLSIPLSSWDEKTSNSLKHIYLWLYIFQKSSSQKSFRLKYKLRTSSIPHTHLYLAFIKWPWASCSKPV